MGERLRGHAPRRAPEPGLRFERDPGSSSLRFRLHSTVSWPVTWQVWVETRLYDAGVEAPGVWTSVLGDLSGRLCQVLVRSNNGSFREVWRGYP